MTCRLTVSTVMKSFSAMARLGRPLAISVSTSCSRVDSGAAIPGTAPRCGDRAPAPWRSNASISPDRNGAGDRPHAELLEATARRQLAQQRPDHRALVEEHPHVALRRGERERLGEGPQRRGAVARGVVRQHLQQPQPQHARGAFLGDREGPPALQHRERGRGLVLGDQHAGPAPGARASRRYDGSSSTERPADPHPLRRLRDIAAGHREQRAQRGHREARVEHGLGHRPVGLVDGGERARRVALRVPEPREDDQARDQGGEVREPAALLDARGDQPVRVGQLVAFEVHLGEPDVQHARGRRRSIALR